MTITTRSAALFALVVAAGCYGGTRVGGSGGGDAGGTAGTDGANGGQTGGYVESELPAPTTRYARLTHVQWENTVRDLLHGSEWTGLSEHFRADPLQSGYLFDNNALALEVDGALWSGYQRAAAEAAAIAVGDPQTFAAIIPSEGGDEAERAEAFIRGFGQRAFRRPLAAEEVATYSSLFAAAPDYYADGDGFAAGVRLVVESMLQSPHFLYRIEGSTERDGDVIALDDWEVASRMSYFLWNSMPDEPLFAAAADGGLTTLAGVEAQARRMLEDPRAHAVVEHFHAQMFESADFSGIAPADAVYPDAPTTLGTSAITELRMFVEDVVFAREGGLHELLTSTRTFVNADLAAVYGLDGEFDEEFTAVELDPGQRKGLLTQVGFLANNSTSVHPDPIHRGVFVSERIACNKIPAPPDGAPPVPPPEGKSNRETVEEHTEAPGTSCQGCHATLINPFGFPFEHYDAIGAFRLEDADRPVDASASVPLAGQRHDVADALELVDVLAQSQQVHACYLSHWVEYAHGRPHADEDDALVERLATYSAEDDESVKELLLEIVTSQPFLTRAQEELQ